MNKINKITNLLLFILVQFLIALFAMYLMNLFSIVKLDTIYSFLVIILFYILIFILPIYLYLKYYEKTSILMFLKLDKKIFYNIGIGLLIGLFILLISILMNRFNFNLLPLSESVVLIIIGNILVGFLEEVPFRGFYLQKFNYYFSFSTSNIITSLLFSFLHLPSLIINGSEIFITCFLLFIISMWMGYIFKKTQSLWVVITVHSLYNLIIFFYNS